MTLLELLTALQNASKMLVTVLDGSGKELIKFYAEGYDQVVDEILVENVAKLTINGNNAITVVIGEVSA